MQPNVGVLRCVRRLDSGGGVWQSRRAANRQGGRVSAQVFSCISYRFDVSDAVPLLRPHVMRALAAARRREDLDGSVYTFECPPRRAWRTLLRRFGNESAAVDWLCLRLATIIAKALRSAVAGCRGDHTGRLVVVWRSLRHALSIVLDDLDDGGTLPLWPADVTRLMHDLFDIDGETKEARVLPPEFLPVVLPLWQPPPFR
jgi:hypothetical protein